MPRVRVSPLLEGMLRDAGLDPSALMASFSDWQDLRQQAERRHGDPDHPDGDHYEFGKDAFNRGSRVGRHVHLVPIATPGDIEVWNRAWRRGGRRTSDRLLFYAAGGVAHGFLLLLIVDDPGGHAVFAERDLMSRLEAWADAFVAFGRMPEVPDDGAPVGNS